MSNIDPNSVLEENPVPIDPNSAGTAEFLASIGADNIEPDGVEAPIETAVADQAETPEKASKGKR